MDDISGGQETLNPSLTPAQARQKVLTAVAAAILDAFSFDESATSVMDYACGSGALSQKLAPYSKRILGVDVDPKVVQQYNAKVINQGIPLEDMQAICADLHTNPAGLSGEQFDIIVCSQAYHHFPSIGETTRLLASFLKPQGMLFVSDLVKGAHADEYRRSRETAHHHHEVIHNGGLTEHDIRGSFERAGLVETEFEIVERVVRAGREIEVFLMQGVKQTGSDSS